MSTLWGEFYFVTPVTNNNFSFISVTMLFEVCGNIFQEKDVKIQRNKYILVWTELYQRGPFISR